MKKIYFVLIGLLACTLTFSQAVLKAKLNGLRAGDKIVKQQVEYVLPGMDGADVLWDFTRLNTVNRDYLLVYFLEPKKDLSQIVGWEHQTRYYYLQRNDSVMMTGYRNRTVSMHFEKPEVQMVFPLHYGDTLSTEFRGHGLCYQDLAIPAVGSTIITANAFGTLITPGQDTLKNVLRIKRVRKYSEVGVDSTGMILETYQWYAPGYRYPVFETVKSMVIKNDSTIDDNATAFYFPPAAIESLADDPENATIRECAKQEKGIIINCTITPNPVKDECMLLFTLSVSARVTIQLCNIMGVPLMPVAIDENMEAGAYQKSILMSGLPKGNYVIHIKANNYFTSRVLFKE